MHPIHVPRGTATAKDAIFRMVEIEQVSEVDETAILPLGLRRWLLWFSRTRVLIGRSIAESIRRGPYPGEVTDTDTQSKSGLTYCAREKSPNGPASRSVGVRIPGKTEKPTERI